MNKKITAIALLFPIIALMSLTAYKKIKIETGSKIILKIEGYDPRDLLSGHYITFRVKYNAKNICKKLEYNRARKAYICLDSNQYFSYDKPAQCHSYIEGTCKGSRFKAGLNRFYIPQEHAHKLDKLVRNKNASIEVSVANGKALITDLLINDRSWKSHLNID